MKITSKIRKKDPNKELKERLDKILINVMDARQKCSDIIDHMKDKPKHYDIKATAKIFKIAVKLAKQEEMLHRVIFNIHMKGK